MKKEQPQPKQEIEKLGGAEGFLGTIYERDDQVPYFDKGGHKMRSIANYVAHLKFWKKNETL